MLRDLSRILTSRAAGSIWLILVIALGAALAAVSVQAGRTEAALRARIVALDRANQTQAAFWRAQLRDCTAAPQAGGGGEAERVRRLAEQAPAGFDVCARMESADRAVLQTLK